MVTVGSVWNSSDFKAFKVFDVVNDGAKNWVHYHLYEVNKNNDNQPRYSCYEEAFVQRFSKSVV